MRTEEFEQRLGLAFHVCRDERLRSNPSISLHKELSTLSDVTGQNLNYLNGMVLPFCNTSAAIQTDLQLCAAIESGVDELMNLGSDHQVIAAAMYRQQ